MVSCSGGRVQPIPDRSLDVGSALWVSLWISLVAGLCRDALAWPGVASGVAQAFRQLTPAAHALLLAICWARGVRTGVLIGFLSLSGIAAGLRVLVTIGDPPGSLLARIAVGTVLLLAWSLNPGRSGLQGLPALQAARGAWWLLPAAGMLLNLV